MRIITIRNDRVKLTRTTAKLQQDKVTPKAALPPMLSFTLAASLLVGALSVSSRTGSAHASVPAQYFYEPELASSISLHEPSGCELMSWDGTDEDGVSGYPWVSTIVCPAGKTFRDSGIVKNGHIRIFLWSGEIKATTTGAVAAAGRAVDDESPSPADETSAHLNLTGSASVLLVAFVVPASSLLQRCTLTQSAVFGLVPVCISILSSRGGLTSLVRDTSSTAIVAGLPRGFHLLSALRAVALTTFGTR